MFLISEIRDSEVYLHSVGRRSLPVSDDVENVQLHHLCSGLADVAICLPDLNIYIHDEEIFNYYTEHVCLTTEKVRISIELNVFFTVLNNIINFSRHDLLLTSIGRL